MEEGIRSIDRIMKVVLHRTALLTVLIALALTCLTQQVKAETYTLLDEDFEDGLGEFTIGEPNGLWHLTAVCDAVEPNHSTPTALYYGLDEICTYEAAGTTEGVVTSSVIDLTDVEAPIRLEFNYWLETENYFGVDLATVEISQDGGLFYEYLSNDFGTLKDPSPGWTLATLDLSAMAGKEIQIRFQFQTIDELANNFSGFYVDDVLVIGNAGETPVFFADSNLELAVETELGITDPGPTDMLGLINLAAQEMAITDLTGLEYALNLATLNIAQNQVVDLFPLSGLTDLTNLNIAQNQIIDLSPLSGLINLTDLDVSDNQVTSIKSLSGFSSLIYLDLTTNPLNRTAYCAFLPTIKDSNPGIDLYYDPSPHTARPGDYDGDCDVDFYDFSILSNYWLENFDFSDLEVLVYNWLQADVCDGDVDGDCYVDFYDYSILSNYWLQEGCGDCGGADLSGDNNVDLTDLEILGLNWLANL